MCLEPRLIPLDCACSFGSAIPIAAVRSETALPSPEAAWLFLTLYWPTYLALCAWVTVPPSGYEAALQLSFAAEIKWVFFELEAE